MEDKKQKVMIEIRAKEEQSSNHVVRGHASAFFHIERTGAWPANVIMAAVQRSSLPYLACMPRAARGNAKVSGYVQGVPIKSSSSGLCKNFQRAPTSLSSLCLRTLKKWPGKVGGGPFVEGQSLTPAHHVYDPLYPPKKNPWCLTSKWKKADTYDHPTCINSVRIPHPDSCNLIVTTPFTLTTGASLKVAPPPLPLFSTWHLQYRYNTFKQKEGGVASPSASSSRASWRVTGQRGQKRGAMHILLHIFIRSD
eukprot:765152-Hanusia_phi.AAC.2